MSRLAPWVFVAVAALTALPTATAASPEAVLTDLIESRRPVGDVRLQFETGRPDYRGRSVLSLTGEGAMVLETRSGDDVGRHEGWLSEKAVGNLLRLLVDIKVWTLQTEIGVVPPDAEEMTVRITTRQSDIDLEVHFLVTDAADSPELLALLDLFHALRSVVLGET